MKILMIFSGAFKNPKIAKRLHKIIRRHASKDTPDRDVNHVITFLHPKEKCNNILIVSETNVFLYKWCGFSICKRYAMTSGETCEVCTEKLKSTFIVNFIIIFIGTFLFLLISMRVMNEKF